MAPRNSTPKQRVSIFFRLFFYIFFRRSCRALTNIYVAVHKPTWQRGFSDEYLQSRVTAHAHFSSPSMRGSSLRCCVHPDACKSVRHHRAKSSTRLMSLPHGGVHPCTYMVISLFFYVDRHDIVLLFSPYLFVHTFKRDDVCTLNWYIPGRHDKCYPVPTAATVGEKNVTRI